MKNLKLIFDFRNKKVLLRWVVLVSLLIFLGIIYFFYLVYHKDKPVFVPEETRKDVRGSIEENVAQPLAKVWPKLGRALLNASFNNQKNSVSDQGGNTNAADPTANWQTYESKELGISFKYPEGWEIFKKEVDYLALVESSAVDQLKEAEEKYRETDAPIYADRVIVMYRYNTDSSPEEFANELLSPESLGKIERKTTKNGLNGFIVIDEGPNRFGGGRGYSFIFSIKNKAIIEISLDTIDADVNSTIVKRFYEIAENVRAL